MNADRREEQSQRARQTQSEGVGGLTRHGVIANHDCVAAFQGQREHLGLTRPRPGENEMEGGAR